jgi:hypothetical protein
MHVRVRRLSSAARDRTSVPARIQARSTRTVAGVIEERAASRSLRRRSDPDRNAYVQQITRRSERHFAGAMARVKAALATARRCAALTRAMRSRSLAIIGASGPCSYESSRGSITWSVA